MPAATGLELFPHPPYPIQNEFVEGFAKIVHAPRAKGDAEATIGILESPTGTVRPLPLDAQPPPFCLACLGAGEVAIAVGAC